MVEQLGLARVLELAPNTYYRMRAIACSTTVLSPADVVAICRDHPQELVWASNDCERRDYLLNLLREYRTDFYLLNRIVGCIGRIAGKAEVSQAVAVACEVSKETQSGAKP